MYIKEVHDFLVAAINEVTSGALVEKRKKNFIDPTMGKFV